MCDCYVELLHVVNVPASVLGGRPNVLAVISLDDGRTASNSRQHYHYRSRTPLYHHAPHTLDVRTKVLFPRIRYNDTTGMVIRVSLYDQVEAPCGYIGTATALVGGPHRAVGMRSIPVQYTPEGVEHEQETAVNSGTAVVMAWELIEATTEARQRVQQKWEQLYASQVLLAMSVSTNCIADTIINTADTTDTNATIPIITKAENNNSENSNNANTAITVLNNNNNSILTEASPREQKLVQRVAELENALHHTVEQEVQRRLKDGNSLTPYAATTNTGSNNPISSALLTIAAPSGYPQEQQSQMPSTASNTWPLPCITDKESVVGHCAAVQSILKEPCRPLSREDQLLLTAYYSFRQCNNTDASTRKSVPSLLPHHGCAVDALSVFGLSLYHSPLSTTTATTTATTTTTTTTTNNNDNNSNDSNTNKEGKSVYSGHGSSLAAVSVAGAALGLGGITTNSGGADHRLRCPSSTLAGAKTDDTHLRADPLYQDNVAAWTRALRHHSTGVQLEAGRLVMDA